MIYKWQWSQIAEFKFPPVLCIEHATVVKCFWWVDLSFVAGESHSYHDEAATEETLKVLGRKNDITTKRIQGVFYYQFIRQTIPIHLTQQYNESEVSFLWGVASRHCVFGGWWRLDKLSSKHPTTWCHIPEERRSVFRLNNCKLRVNSVILEANMVLFVKQSVVQFAGLL